MRQELEIHDLVHDPALVLLAHARGLQVERVDYVYRLLEPGDRLILSGTSPRDVEHYLQGLYDGLRTSPDF